MGIVAVDNQSFWRKRTTGSTLGIGLLGPGETPFSMDFRILDAGSIRMHRVPVPPPAITEKGIDPAPSEDHFGVPGCWVWRGDGYVWRPRYRSRSVGGWTWMPAMYPHTPRGVVYAEGHWDYPLDRRGYLFASVYFSQPVYLQPGYAYRPVSLVEIGLLTANPFIQRRNHHYYYGDYFGACYFGCGFTPWYSYSLVLRWR